MLGLIIGGIMILYGLYGIVKKEIFAPWALRAKGRYQMEAAKNIPFTEKTQMKNYLIYGTWAVVEGVLLVIIGLLVIVANF